MDRNNLNEFERRLRRKLNHELDQGRVEGKGDSRLNRVAIATGRMVAKLMNRLLSPKQQLMLKRRVVRWLQRRGSQ